jgi:hypothetical protein
MQKSILKKYTINKIISFVLNKYLSFPTLKFLLNTKTIFIKDLYINFWLYISKGNKNFQKFFFKGSNDVNKSIDKIHFNIHENVSYLNNNCLEILETYGVLVIENALTQNEHSEIVKIFKNLKIKNNTSLKQNDYVLKYFEEIEITNFINLQKISNFFTKHVYGKFLKAYAQFHIHQSKKIPETNVINGDNNMHIDRFLPNMKIYYSPFDITSVQAPFCYALGSHKINSYYVNYIKRAKFFSEEDSMSKKFLNFKKELVCKKNSLIVALTNGFHARKPFLKIAKRQVVFLQYHKSFNKTSLLAGKFF